MKTAFQIGKVVILFFLLSIYTQVGGLLYLLYQPLSYQLKKRKRWHLPLRILSFGAIMLVSSLLLTPLLARFNGRVPLPVYGSEGLRPARFLTVVSNRHYVRPALKDAMLDVTASFRKDYPDANVYYLDAGFPFLESFPLLPHLSHDDGEKLDLAFVYKRTESGAFVKRPPGFMGYGYLQAPEAGEWDQAAACANEGYWQYSLLSKLTKQDRASISFDTRATARLLQHITRHKSIGKLFIEPHLKARLGMGGSRKVRFQGCPSVRHDDHIHLQL